MDHIDRLRGDGLDDPATYERNVENYAGTVRVPVGLAGPLRIDGGAARGTYDVPLATTEAALVASYSRGAQLISYAGGCVARVLDARMRRAPVLAFDGLEDAMLVAAWIRANIPRLRAAAEATSHHATLLAIEPSIEGNHLYLDCAYATGEAAGQNMVTFATDALCAELVAAAPVRPRSYAVESNASGDKKATARAMLSTRGRRVCAEARIPAALLAERLRVTPGALCAYWQMGAVGATMTGAIGLQGMYANALAAFYLATGQDVACVAESAIGITRFEVARDGALYASVTMPNVVVASIGGGTGLPTQRASARMLARDGESPCADALAEIVAAIVLAGEISLTASLCAHDFSAAHRRFARRAPGAVA
ncbi:MAG TPA: hydroxymethylglutaryl-CoA reductase [Candidatus Elarobacter sp.]|jgi:hydroxymethylglutaryl-CoA reductase (NADPH)|nr:hydroxymethylglutaryl-CoA reductase [Candidatus Elarobacter sp.]